MIDKINNVKQKLNRKLNSDAVSSTISLILVLMIFFSAAGAVLMWGPNYIKSEENRQQIKATVNQYDYLVEALCSLTEDGAGATSISKIVINEGSIEIDSKGEKLIILYSNDEDWDFNVTGLDDPDSHFSVDMTNGQDVDSVTIYWLDDTCFLAGTKITMADGSYRSIEDIKAGDVVRSYDEASGSFVDARVKKLLSYDRDHMSDYYLIINNRLRVTPNHRLFVNNKWIEAGKLKVGDVLFDVASRKISLASQKILLFSIEKRFSKEPSFDLLLESGFTYFADGFLAKSDVDQEVTFDLSDETISAFLGSSDSSIGVRKMACAPTKLKPLGAGPFDGEGRTFSADEDDGGKDVYISEWYQQRTKGCDEYYLTISCRWGVFPKRRRAFIYFPITEEDGIPTNSYIEDAELWLYYFSTSGNEVDGWAVMIHEVSGTSTKVWSPTQTSWKHWNKDEGENGEWDEYDIPASPSEPYGGDCREGDIAPPPDEPPGRVAKSDMPDNVGEWVIFSGGPESYGLEKSVQDFVDEDRVNYGWLISGKEYLTGPIRTWAFASSRVIDQHPGAEYTPRLRVHYVTKP